jgi:cell fate (sporulation/competence/biofilm development) regulator YlbF (YheA/YmcA/DUF963 family)
MMIRNRVSVRLKKSRKKEEVYFMSNLYDQAHGLAKALKESEEFKSLKSIQAQINAEPTTKKMVDDFRQTQLELQMKQMQGQEISESDVEQAQKLFETIQLNPTVNRLFEIEQRFSLIMEDVNKIMMEPLQEIYQEDSKE